MSECLIDWHPQYQQVRYTGVRREITILHPLAEMRPKGVLNTGAAALMRGDGRVQLNGTQDYWRAPPEVRNPLCYGWHDCGTEWEVIDD